MNTNHTESIFEQIGGVFCTPADLLAEKLKTIKAFVFDWDGVFNNAVKNENKSSNFNEADSMGTNMLRFNHFIHNRVYRQQPLFRVRKMKWLFTFVSVNISVLPITKHPIKLLRSITFAG